MEKINKSRILKFLSGAIVLIVLSICAVFFPELSDISDDSQIKYTDYPFCVSFIDVGQGDCALISCKDVNILVDGGEADSSRFVLDFLKRNNVDELDCYILSHPHSDHIGASPAIIKEIKCNKVFTTYFSEFNIPTSYLYERLIDTIYEYADEAIAVEAGDSFTFGDLKIEILAPITESDDYNEMSIVFSVTYKDATVLFTGDTTVPVEKQMLDAGNLPDVDVLKTAHHGSSTSSYPEFIAEISPEIAVISCGTNNSYGHPHRETIELFDESEIKYYRTDYSGTIYYYGDGYDMQIGETR